MAAAATQADSAAGLAGAALLTVATPAVGDNFLAATMVMVHPPGSVVALDADKGTATATGVVVEGAKTADRGSDHPRTGTIPGTHRIQTLTSGSRPFRFFNMWLKHEGFNGLVSQSWEAGVVGSKQFSLCSKLKRLKPPLKSLNKQAFGHISRRAMEAKEEYGLVMKCTSYFHSIVKKNRRKNIVGFLVTEDGSKTTSKNEVANIFVDYFTTLFGTTSSVEPIELEILTAGTRVPSSAQSSLLASVTPEEVREAVFDIGNDKALGPDGYTAAFFKDQWAVVGRDIYEAVLEFFTSGKLLRQINHAMIVLIPKSSHKPTVKDFRPIACLNVLYKVITKILAKRMAPLLPDLIDPAQGAFVPGRSLVDNFLIAQHLICWNTGLRLRRTKLCSSL
ncbi:unnamed protein product [Cuscuta campestris]|uniref:Uncharacterized protein n=1 Tax=Cuscuta campestris TaxID=132261 RepID=A0A484N9V3_9ASTE|nr:unnamed protein product [Cuscuta campestris]